MFGSKKIEMLQSQIRDLTDRLDQVTREKDEVQRKLSDSLSKVSGLESKVTDLETELADRDLEQLKEDARTTQAEFEGLKSMYSQKVQEFNASVEEKEQEFAKEAAVAKHNLQNEIRDSRQANQDFVAGTVKNFSESFNYYLNQIKLLMETLGDVASRTGESLFAGANDDLKGSIGQEIVEKLKAKTDDLRNGDEGGLVLIRA